MKQHTMPLEIHVYLEDGRVTKFAQQDPEIAQNILRNIVPCRLFEDGVLLLGDGEAVVAFQSSKVVRIDFLTEEAPSWPMPQNLLTIEEITQEEFQERRCAQQQRQEPPEWMTLRLPVTQFAELELINGAMVWMQVRVRQERRLPLEQSLFLHHFFTARGLYARHQEGGFVVINHASIARITFYPGTRSATPGVWQATCMDSFAA